MIDFAAGVISTCALIGLLLYVGSYVWGRE
jgi:hypothetical protein